MILDSKGVPLKVGDNVMHEDSSSGEEAVITYGVITEFTTKMIKLQTNPNSTLRKLVHPKNVTKI